MGFQKGVGCNMSNGALALAEAVADALSGAVWHSGAGSLVCNGIITQQSVCASWSVDWHSTPLFVTGNQWPCLLWALNALV